MYGYPQNVLHNNPLNLRTSNLRWQGKVTPAGAEFEHFDTAFNGLRAGAKNVLNYQKIHGLNTVAEIIARYAPSSENPTPNYIAFMCRRLAVGQDDPINLSDPFFLSKWVNYQIIFEQGVQPYDFDFIQKGVNAALV